MIQDTIREIRTQCRLKMNGVASTSMREKGLTYKLNFGLMIPQINELAKNYSPDAQLAQTLWKEDVRELKILATLLYPIAEFNEKIALRWIDDIANQEMREQLCFNILQNTPFAIQLIDGLSAADNENVRATAYWLLARLYIAKKINAPILLECLPKIWTDLDNDKITIRNAALLALKHLGRHSSESAQRILLQVENFKIDANPVKQEIYDSLYFEFQLV